MTWRRIANFHDRAGWVQWNAVPITGVLTDEIGLARRRELSAPELQAGNITLAAEPRVARSSERPKVGLVNRKIEGIHRQFAAAAGKAAR